MPHSSSPPPSSSSSTPSSPPSSKESSKEEESPKTPPSAPESGGPGPTENLPPDPVPEPISRFDVDVPATIHGTLAVEALGLTVRSGLRASDYDAGTYAFEASSSAPPPSARATATPDEGHVLCAWPSKAGFAPRGGVLAVAPPSDPESFDITAATSLAAPTFAKYHTVTISPAAGGTVSVTTDDAGAVGAPTTIYVRDGWALSLSKNADPGYRLASDDTPANITADCTITVVFEQIPVVTPPITTPTPVPPSSDHFTHGDDADFISQATEASRKHLMLKVPDYELARPEGYGSTSPSWDPAQSQKNAFVQIGDATEFVAGANANNAVWGTDLLAGHVEFIDDQRYRGDGDDHGDQYDYASVATPPNEDSVRASGPYSPYASAEPDPAGPNLAVTATIPDYIGWRDHTDGHRITTTRGDKIEIIGGNYKVVSLGRGTGDAAFEMSGGLIIDGDVAPGDTTSVTWRDCPTDSPNKGWKVVEQTVKGHVVERFHGTKREEAYGDDFVSVTGSPGEDTSGTGLGADQDDSSHNGEHVELSVTTTDPPIPTDSKAVPTKWDEFGSALPKLQKPNIHESSWVKAIRGYTHAESITEHTIVTGDHSERTRYEGNYKGEVKVVSGKFEEYWYMMGSLGFIEYFHGAMTQFFLGASTTIGLANRLEVFVGAEQQFNLGAFFELRAGISVDVSIGSASEFELLHHQFNADETEVQLNKLEGQLSSMKTTLNDNIAALKHEKSGLGATSRFLLTQL